MLVVFVCLIVGGFVGLVVGDAHVGLVVDGVVGLIVGDAHVGLVVGGSPYVPITPSR